MGLLLRENIADDCLLGIWEITEYLEELLSKVNLSSEEKDILDKFSNESRKIEWLSVRVLLRELSGKDLTIIYNGHRKPFIKGNSYQISISHSKNLSSVLLSRSCKVGIDLEFMSHRIERIAHKFISEKEVIEENERLKKYHLYIHWCAKEALYKICDKQDINFKENLLIDPFYPENRGGITGTVNNIHGKEKFNLHYFSIDNYVVVYTVK